MRNLEKLFSTQKRLDERINKEKDLEGQNLLDKKILALQVELGELANEWRGFKFWSENQKPRTKVVKAPTMSEEDKEYYNPMLGEYVDCLHFILSIGLELEFDTDEWIIEPWYEDNIVHQFIILNLTSYEVLISGNTSLIPDLLSYFVGLGEMLGFTWEQIEQAYFDKNKINHERQSNGY